MSKAVEEYGLKQRYEGFKEGFKEGFIESYKEGRLEVIIEPIKKLLKKGTLSYGEISETFDISVEEVQRIAAQVS